MQNQSTFSIVNPQNNNLAFQYMEFKDNSSFDQMQRPNYFSLIWIKEGMGKVNVNLSEYDFEANNLFAFSPYQRFMLNPEKSVNGIAIHFHYDFFCILKHHKEVMSNGVLYNNIYQPPFVLIDEVSAITFQMLCNQIKSEM